MSPRTQLHLEIQDAVEALSSGSSTSPSLSAITLPFVTPISGSSSSTSRAVEPRKELAQTPELAEFGPHYFHRRRTRWLTPTEDDSGVSKPWLQMNSKDSIARAKLEKLIAESDINDDEAWAAGISTVWNGLVNGGRLKKPLPLDIVIKVLKAGWHRDGTWPKGLIVPPSPPAPLPIESELIIAEEVILPESIVSPTSTPTPATVEERLIRIEGAGDTGYLSDASRARLEQALEKCDGNLGNLADEDILRLKYDRTVVLETQSGCK